MSVIVVFAIIKLRNVVPRQGTETLNSSSTVKLLSIIEKCSSPTGDGNQPPEPPFEYLHPKLRNVVPRQGTETIIAETQRKAVLLRNVVPRQGTETTKTSASNSVISSLRNVVPRQGTETFCLLSLSVLGI